MTADQHPMPAASIEQVLTERFGLSEEALAEARNIQVEKGGSLGDILVRRKAVSEVQLLEARSILYDLPFWPTLPLEQLRGDFTEKVPIGYLKRYLMVPLEMRPRQQLSETSVQGETQEGGNGGDQTDGVILAVNDLSHFPMIDDLVRLLEVDRRELVLSTKNAILDAINMAYDLTRDSAEQLVQDMEEDGSDILDEIEESADLLDDTSDAPIIKLVNHIISQSVKARASDIHIEPYQDSFKVRYRVDGILYDLLTPPKWIQPALTSRIKVMAKLNIAEKRLPQDGRINVKIGDQEVDIRVSTIPTSFGERVVLRLLNKSGSLFQLSDLGLVPVQRNQLEALIKSPNGIFLVTGPTGSGKTTTLYAILSSINKPDINIITVEDPVEYQIKGISQIQVNPKIDLTFARGLRSIVRQDPDVILIGEIRDRETADIAVQSALTGHLVFSTLHTNDSASAITRLVDIGVEPFLISSSVLAVAAQRLVRRLCDACKEPFEPSEAVLKTAGISPGDLKNGHLYRAKGCTKCFHTGYRGRVGIFEIMVMEDSLKNLILETYDSNRIKAEALRLGMTTLRQDGISKVIEGVSTIEEILRVTRV